MMETVNCYDASNRPTDHVTPRNALKDSPCYFRVVHLWWEVEGEWLVQKRAKADDVNPYMWAFTTGLVTQDETPKDTVIRETREELHVDLDPDSLSLLKIVPTHTGPYKTFAYIYLTHQAKQLTAPSAEVLEAAWWPMTKIHSAIQAGTFWDYPVLLNAPAYFSFQASDGALYDTD